MTSYLLDNNAYAPDDDIESGGNNRWFNLFAPGYLPESRNVSIGLMTLTCPDGIIQGTAGSGMAASNKMVSKNSGFVHKSLIKATANDALLFMDTFKSWRVTHHTYMRNDLSIDEGSPNANIRHVNRASVTFLDGSGKSKSISFFLQRNSSDHTFWDVE